MPTSRPEHSGSRRRHHVGSATDRRHRWAAMLRIDRGLPIAGFLTLSSGLGGALPTAAAEATVLETASEPVSPLLAAAIGAVLLGLVLLVAMLLLAVVRRYRRRAGSRQRLEQLYREAQAGAFDDALTGAGNRAAFEARMAAQIDAYLTMGVPFVVALIDVDDLNVVNQAEGQAAGDDVIHGIGETLQQLARREDLLYRIGGDEFAMIMPGAEIASATSIVARALHFCRRPPSGIRPSSFSAGVSGVPYFSTDGEIVVRQAAAALEWVKAHGRGAVEVFEPERDRVPDHPHDIAAEAVQHVVAGKMLAPVFQPIVDLRSGRVLGFEGLIRPDPRGPLPDTARLFAAAAVSGRTVELDLACIDVVLDGARAIGHDRVLTLNLSPRTLEVKDFDAAWLLKGLVRNGISPGRVIVELTERDAISDVRRMRETFANLQQHGLRVAADDVGAGNADMQLLTQVRFDIIKVDLGLVHASAVHDGSRAQLESLRDLAASQSATIVAEGLETARQLQVVQGMQIGAGQGYLLGRPAAAADAAYVDVRRLSVEPAAPNIGRRPGRAPVAVPVQAPAASPRSWDQAPLPALTVVPPGPALQTRPDAV